MSVSTITHRALFDASIEIGGIVESAAWFTDLLILDIEETGKAVGQMTVDELVALVRARRDSIIPYPGPENAA